MNEQTEKIHCYSLRSRLNSTRIGMHYSGAQTRASVFLSCIKENHHSREVTLPQHALVHIFSGTMTIAYGQHTYTFQAGATLLIPRNQLGRMAKFPASDGPFKSISILLPEELLRKFYANHPVNATSRHDGSKHHVVTNHPVLGGLFQSLLPYFDVADELPADISDIKVQETLTLLHAFDQRATQILSSFDEPGKIDLADFMDQNFMFNLSLEKFGYLTGRSLTTFKKDFKRIYKTTPGRWLTQKRLELAYYQLAVRKQKPSDVYVEAGFENLSHFSFAFKKQFGHNPTNMPDYAQTLIETPVNVSEGN